MSFNSLTTIAKQSGFSKYSTVGHGQAGSRVYEIPMDIELVDTIQPALEASQVSRAMKNLGINVEGTPMLVECMGDNEINMNRLPEVTSPAMFIRGDEPTEDGLFSYEIFGKTTQKRKLQYAYIDLHKKFFHPYIYECLCKVMQNAQKVAAGMDCWEIVEGNLVKIPPEADNYDPTQTGLRWLIDHFKELKFTKNDSYIHNQYVDVILNSREDQIFISKFLVIPVAYRDANMKGKRDIPEINEHYKRLLQLVKALKGSSMAMFMNNTEMNIQTAMVTIRNYGQSLIAGKRGFLKQYVLGKTTVYAARNVITQPVYSGCTKPSELMVDMFHTGFPIATCCSMAYPFIEHWILNFIAREFEMRPKKNVIRKQADGTLAMTYEKVGDVGARYTPQYIETKVDQFIETYGNRFEPVTIPMMDGTDAYVVFPGKPKDNPDDKAVRYMTWTDLLYLACVESLENTGKMAYVTRYPMVDYFGSFPTMIRVTSTAKTMPMVIDGVTYQWYPVIDVNATKDRISTMFKDTVNMDNVYLDGIGGDYDGDTTSEKTMFTEEANQEAFDLMTDVTRFVSIGGKLVQTIKNETYLTFYAMTHE